MSEFAGFISDKLEIKLLILYIADRLVEAAPFEVLQELSMCDQGVDYFAFSDCLADLVRTEHLTLKDDKYLITRKGRDNIRACESGLPYSVRTQVDKAVVAFNHQLRRSSLVTSQVSPRPKGGFTVSLSLSDELDNIMKMELMVTQERMARRIERNFQSWAEDIYSKIIEILYEDGTKSKGDKE